MFSKIYTKTPYVLLCLLIGFLSFLILYHANWIFGDDHGFLSTTASGNYSRLFIVPIWGRFMPLAGFDFNILLIFGITSAFAHYLISAISFLAFSLFTNLFYYNFTKNEISKQNIIWLTLFAFIITILSNNFMMIFMHIIYPERMLVVFLTGFMLFYLLAMQEHKQIFYILAAVCASLSMYYKEVVFGIYLVLIISVWLFSDKAQRKELRIFNTLMLASITAFLLMYYFIAFVNISSAYNERRVELGRWGIFLEIIRNNKIFIVAFLLACYRFFILAVKKDNSKLFSDTLLFMGLAYTFAYWVLKLSANYYFIPAYLLILPALIVFSLQVFKSRNLIFKTILIILIAYFLNYSYKITHREITAYIVERDNVIPKFNELAKKIDAGNRIYFYTPENYIYYGDKNYSRNLFVDQQINWIKNNIIVKYFQYINNVQIPYSRLDKEVPISNTQTMLDKTNFDLTENEILLYTPLFNEDISSLLIKNDVKCEQFSPNTPLLICEKVNLNRLSYLETNEIMFNNKSKLNNIYYTGLSIQEPTGIWTDGEIARIVFKVKSNKEIKVQFDGFPFLSEKTPIFSFDIFQKDKYVTSIEYNINKPALPINLMIPAEMNTDGLIDLKFEFKNLQSPLELGLSTDTRKLGFYFQKMTILEN